MNKIATVTWSSPQLTPLKQGLDEFKRSVEQDGHHYLYHEYNYVPRELKYELVMYVRKGTNEYGENPST